jgi:hypothetical protein
MHETLLTRKQAVSQAGETGNPSKQESTVSVSFICLDNQIRKNI